MVERCRVWYEERREGGAGGGGEERRRVVGTPCALVEQDSTVFRPGSRVWV
jgi:hypothetical protein